MKVRELQEELSKLNPQLEVFCYCEDKKLVDEHRGFILLDVFAVESTKAKRIRLDDGTPYLKLAMSQIRRLSLS